MLIFLEARLAFLATPKTGTTAIERALRRHSDIAFTRGRKHMPARRFDAKVAPFLLDAFDCKIETVALMREPVAQLRSWYRYRARDDKVRQTKSTQGVTFETFVSDVISDHPPEYARINGQYNFLCKQNDLIVDHLFAYTHMDAFRRFVCDRLQIDVSFPTKNVSPQIETPLSPGVEDELRTVRAAEFALYDRVVAAGGHLTRA